MSPATSPARTERTGRPRRSGSQHALDIGVALVPAAILVILGVLLVGSAGRDDAHITYWAAHYLSQSGEILNFNGERVEQSSSLLQVLLLALAQRISGVDMVTLGRLFSITFGVATLGAISFFAKRASAHRSAFSAALLTASFPYFIYWSFGGLESTLVACFGTLLLVAVGDYLTHGNRRTLLVASGCMVLFSLARPETPLLLGCLLAAAPILLVFQPTGIGDSGSGPLLRRVLTLGMVHVVSVGAIVSFRWMYFGDVFPQPVHAKSGGLSRAVVRDGIEYLMDIVWRTDWSITLLGAVAGAAGLSLLIRQFRTRAANPYVILGVMYVAGTIAFIVAAGGGWMEGGRFLVPVIPVGLALIPVAFASASRSPISTGVAMIALLGLEARAGTRFLDTSSTGTGWAPCSETGTGCAIPSFSWFETHNRVHLRDIPVAQHLNEMIPYLLPRDQRRLIVLTGQMGLVPYHTAMQHYGAIRFIDKFGLVERTLSDCTLTQDLPHTSRGLRLSYPDFFGRYPGLETVCDIPRPDLIFDVGTPAMHGTDFADHGYTLVYTQQGPEGDAAPQHEGADIRMMAFIAVRNDLVSLLPPQYPLAIQLGR